MAASDQSLVELFKNSKNKVVINLFGKHLLCALCRFSIVCHLVISITRVNYKNPYL